MAWQRRQSTADARALRVLAAMLDASGEGPGWVAATELVHVMHAVPPPRAAQTLGRELRRLERRGLIESRLESWGFMYRPAAPVRALLLPQTERRGASRA